MHKDFNVRVAHLYPDITPNEYRLMAFIRMNLSSKEIASILNISIPGIKKARQRLRKKMGLATQDSLETAILNI
ncbi:MAG: helix-turn-helix transcriptional regulator [Saprospiraceae bacterium]